MNQEFLKQVKKVVRLGDKFLETSRQKSFHFEAASLLSAHDLHKLFDYKNCVYTAFSKVMPLVQNFKQAEFSDLPLTIARGKHCFIDLYFWRRRPTTIHNHHFSGAFQCLYGANVDSEFKFSPEKKLTKFHTLGNLDEIKREEVKPGDIQTINFQDKFIHQNHHHSDLTINLCFRTPDREGKHLSNFYYSGLKYEKSPVSMGLARRLYAFTLMDDFDIKKINITNETALTFLLETLGSSDHPRLNKVQKYLSQKIKDELGLDVLKLLKLHDQKLDKIQSEYE